MSTPLLKVSDLVVRFRSGDSVQTAVNRIHFEVHRGEVLAIVGESGSGKSVTALSILQLNPTPPAEYDAASRIVFDTDGSEAPDLLALDPGAIRNIRGNRIGMIFQEPMTSLNPVLTCGEQVSESLRIHKGLSRSEAKKETIRWFEMVRLGNAAAVYRRYPHQLSGGQKQRVMIAMAMCCDPDLLICDEPTTALDVTVQKTILDLIRELQQRTTMGVIFITHDLDVVGEIADRVLVMYKGDVVEQGKTRDVLTSPSHPYTRALIACRPSRHRRGERLPVVGDFLGQPVKTTVINPVDKRPVGEKIVEVKDLSVWFPAKSTLFGKPKEWFRAVDGVSFDVRRGETLGLVGESGCGKTTLGRALLRLIEPTRGEIRFMSRDFLKIPPKELRPMRRHIQIVFQDPYSSLNPRITIGDAILEPMNMHRKGGSLRSRKDRVSELLRKVDLSPDHYNRYPHEFSGGQRQRIVIARALALDPSFVVCDESVSALDVSVQAQVLNLLNDLKTEFGFTLIFISHDLSVVRYISDRMMVMQAGKIVETGPSDEVYEQPKSDYTKKLISAIPRGLTA